MWGGGGFKKKKGREGEEVAWLLFCLTKRERPKGSECKSELLGEERGNEGHHQHQEHRGEETAGRVAIGPRKKFTGAVAVDTGAVVVLRSRTTPVVKIAVYYRLREIRSVLESLRKGKKRKGRKEKKKETRRKGCIPDTHSSKGPLDKCQ